MALCKATQIRKMGVLTRLPASCRAPVNLLCEGGGDKEIIDIYNIQPAAELRSTNCVRGGGDKEIKEIY